VFLKESGMLQEREKKLVREVFKDLKDPVKLVNFTQELECRFCRDTRQLLAETAELSDKVSLEVYNFQLDKQKVEQYQVDKIPATVIEGEKDCGIRYYGAPVGYEFATLLTDIADVSRGESGLEPQTKRALKKIGRKVHLQVFTTPT
jgi:glutaredoxin-like protein